MSEITMSQVTELTDPKLRQIALRIVREAELAIEKVAANHTQATKFPISSNPKSFEQTLKSRFEVLPEVIKQTASIKAISRINLPAAQRTKHLRDLAGVDLGSTISVDEQVKALPFPTSLKFSANELTILVQSHRETSALAAAATTNKLELRIHKVKCVDETGGFLGELSGDDEIDLGGTTVDETGDAKKVGAFRVSSSFDDGEQKVYSPPKRFTFFNLLEGNVFPKSYFVTLVLSEADMGGLSDFMNKLLDLVKDKIKAALIAAGLPEGPLGALIGAAIGYIVNRVFDFIVAVWSDDIFKPVTVSVNIPSLSARWPGGRTDSPEGTITYSGHDGRYQLTYDWQLYA